MKITAGVTKSLHVDCGTCYLQLTIFSYKHNLLFCWKIKSFCDHCSPQQLDYKSFRVLSSVYELMTAFSQLIVKILVPHQNQTLNLGKRCAMVFRYRNILVLLRKNWLNFRSVSVRCLQ